MKNITGPPVKGDELKFRDKDIKEMISRLADGNSILLTGLRRIGKSSVMMGVEHNAPADWGIFYHNVEDKRLPSDLFSLFLKSLSEKDYEKLLKTWSHLKTVPSRTINLLKQSFKSLDAGGAKVELNQEIIDYWHPLTTGIEQVIKEKKTPVILILDEFPFFIEHMLQDGISKQIVEELLGLLRIWRGRHDHFRLLVGGSISLDHILAKWDIQSSVINDFSRYFLPPFTKDEAFALLEELSIDSGLDWYDREKIEETLCLLGDYYPFFIRSFFREIKIDNGAKPLGVIFENYFIPSIQRGYFDQFSERLKKHYAPEQKKVAKEIFTHLSRQPGFMAPYSQLRDVASEMALSDDFQLDELLADLTADDFLCFQPGTSQYQFVSVLLGKWWKMTRGF